MRMTTITFECRKDRIYHVTIIIHNEMNCFGVRSNRFLICSFSNRLCILVNTTFDFLLGHTENCEIEQICNVKFCQNIFVIIFMILLQDNYHQKKIHFYFNHVNDKI